MSSTPHSHRGGLVRRCSALVPGVAGALGVAMLSVVLAACSSSPPPKPEVVPGGPTGHYTVASGIHKIKHVIVIEQENRSFDSYFGTYPGADGIPVSDGQPTVCVPVPSGGCQKPYHDTADVNGGGPHGAANAKRDVDGGKMDGFIASASGAKKGCGANLDNPACSNAATPDVMGYHTSARQQALISARTSSRSALAAAYMMAVLPSGAAALTFAPLALTRRMAAAWSPDSGRVEQRRRGRRSDIGGQPGERAGQQGRGEDHEPAHGTKPPKAPECRRRST